ncbi:hypothetical protein MASR2M18_02550 [Ignavibacteria bacterium]|nr:hypothetical protein [Bacteroidota bacterium]
MNILTSAILIAAIVCEFVPGSDAFAQNPVTKVVVKRKLVTTTVIMDGKIVSSETKWFLEAICRTGNKSTLKTLTIEEYLELYFDDVHREQEKGVAPVVSGKTKIVSEGNSRILTDEMTIQTTLYGPCR